MVSEHEPDDRGAGAGTFAGTGIGDPERIPALYPTASPLWVLLSRWLLGLEAWLRSHGGTRLRFGLRAFWAVVAIGGAVLLFGPVINPPLTLDDITSSADTATDRWIARTFAVDYRVERADDGTLVAHVEERIGAFFPDGTAEPGIQRVLATEYQGHALSPSNISATVDGRAIDVVHSEVPDRETLTLDAGTSALQGDHAFVLSYDLANLAYDATDTATGQSVDLLQWDVFGPSWPQAFAGLDVSITLPQELDDRLVRQPRGTLAWTLLSSGEWLEPEADAPVGQVTYRFTNEQNIPPHAQARFTMSFEPGTFRMPAPTPLFFVQTLGPLAPLAFLAVTLLLAVAARRVAWGDARGRPWFVAQPDPPEGITPRTAAQVIKAARSMELAETLGAAQKGASKTRRVRLVAAVRVAHRSGRIGDLPRALTRYLTAPERRAQLTSGLRRVPRGFVRDLFIAAPLALTVLQWGLVRQLSEQTKLAIVWWPVAFVLLSSAIAVVVLAIALTARPLTRRGALLKQHLLGIDVFASRTQLLDRTTLKDPLLPYAVLLAPPRAAGEQIVALASAERGGAEDPEGTDWRTPSFLTWPRLVVRALSVLLVVGTVVAVSVLPNPYDRGNDVVSFSGDIPGTLSTTVTSMDAVADLSRTTDGHARLAVTETLRVTFGDEGSRVPQFVQEWPSILNGQSLGLTVQSVTIDGAAVPFATQQLAETVLMKTQLRNVLTGGHDLQVAYALDSAAVAADAGGAVVDRIRWTTLLDGWHYDSTWGDEPAPDPLRIELRVPAELAAATTTAGWNSLDTSASDNPREWPPSVVPFDAPEYAGGVGGSSSSAAGSTGSTARDTTSTTTTAPDGTVSHVLDLRGGDDEGGYPFDLTVDGTGATVDFPSGTFQGPDTGTLGYTRIAAAAPVSVVLLLGALALVFGGLGACFGFSRRPRVFTPGLLRDLVRWLAPTASLATIILFIWMTIDMPSDHPDFAPLGISALVALAAGTAGLLLTRRKRTPKAP
ncbi:hypothetical protein B7R54_04515 [Subtercola boreus]|uniref:DUF2207 domain-containing protein n=1 Tax=Subtercola boreus TaxID=120213 RepID=A0A3E0VFY0_9MICO|nr:DUF2207 domain-containing protein [Subtercola boreus]RFA08569.1 hypothetical protein B7R54_04515 [Subtercola boreus]TQL54496.1 putative membrane protein DUF2207 [Subtercola boreus]